jgi:hypothetical protein
MRRKLLALGLILILILISVVSANAIGVGGESLYIKGNYEAGVTLSDDYIITLSETDDKSHIKVSTQGDLAEYLHPSVTDIYPLEGDSLTFSVDFIMTEKMPEAGNRIGKVCVLDAGEGGSGSINARTKSCIVYEFFVLYEGKKPSYAFNYEVGTEKVEFSISVANNGKEAIESSSAVIEVFSSEGENIGRLDIIGAGVASSGSTILSESFDIIGLSSGDYSAKAILTTDGEESEVMNLDFKIGEKEVEIVSFSETLEISGIQKFEIVLENKWADAQEVSIFVKILDQESEVSTKTIEKFAQETFSLFIETDSIPVGEQAVQLNINLDDEVIKKEELAINFIEAMQEKNVALAGEASGEGIGIGDINIMKITIIGLTLLLVLGIILIAIKKKFWSEADDEDDDEY